MTEGEDSGAGERTAETGPVPAQWVPGSGLGGEDRDGDPGAPSDVQALPQAPGRDRGAQGPSDAPGVVIPQQSPLFHALNQPRYDRQSLIRSYEEELGCRLVVMIDSIFPESITLFEELVHDADHRQDLHLMLNSPGGDGETAVRLVRSAQSRCRELTVIVPDQAKSAGTLLAMGAHHILMGPVSDLGPVDPQLRIAGERGARLVAAKDLLNAFENAQRAVEERPETYPLHASLLADIDAVMLQFARSALARTDELVEEALRSNPDRDALQVSALKDALKEPLIERPSSHAAVFGARDGKQAGLPVMECSPASRQWQLIWRLWTKYFTLVNQGAAIYESSWTSQVLQAGG